MFIKHLRYEAVQRQTTLVRARTQAIFSRMLSIKEVGFIRIGRKEHRGILLISISNATGRLPLCMAATFPILMWLPTMRFQWGLLLDRHPLRTITAIFGHKECRCTTVSITDDQSLLPLLYPPYNLQSFAHRVHMVHSLPLLLPSDVVFR